ncbi:nucleotide-diphospho-sugar transferases superfamily protein [Artemisia annua]|uniref:dolichyl-phosphate beta-glucosyltransferase n=1 Tax=Artemisia annua TaxID=35608 RepID=A0A2U1QA71_ARTAN|nr:nucleotide-diphospho-sugar transferases superfamily protein [Artemisia annua]
MIQAEKYISLIVPAYNEELRLPAALDETMNYLQERAGKDESFTYEVIIVDDGSSDGTKRVAFDFVRKYKVDNVRVVLLGKNQGKGEAIRKGMLHSRGKLLLMLDADGATKVDDLAKLENQILAVAKAKHQSTGESNEVIEDIPIVAFGSRAHLEKKALATRKWYRNFLMKGFHVVVLLAAGPGVRDTQCGFKMFTRAAARKLFTNIRLKRWCFDVELVYLSKFFHIPIVEISVTWSEIPGSKGNQTLAGTISAAVTISLGVFPIVATMWTWDSWYTFFPSDDQSCLRLLPGTTRTAINIVNDVPSLFGMQSQTGPFSMSTGSSSNRGDFCPHGQDRVSLHFLYTSVGLFSFPHLAGLKYGQLRIGFEEISLLWYRDMLEVTLVSRLEAVSFYGANTNFHLEEEYQLSSVHNPSVVAFDAAFWTRYGVQPNCSSPCCANYCFGTAIDCVAYVSDSCGDSYMKSGRCKESAGQLFTDGSRRKAAIRWWLDMGEGH